MTSNFDLYLGDVASLQGYRCRSLVRDSAPLVASKFSTGSAGQSDLDLLKSASVDSLAGGMFQRTQDDPTKASRVVGIFNRFDENVYPTLARSSALTPTVGNGGTVCAKVEANTGSYVVIGTFSAGTYYNALYLAPLGGYGWTSITLPAALASNGFCNITNLTLHKNCLFVASQTASSGTNVNLWRYNITAGTWQDMTASGNVFFTLRGVLYIMNIQSEIYTVTNELNAGAATYTKVTDCGSYSPNSLAIHAIEFNGAAWIAKLDGLYRFDGVTALKILPLQTFWLQVFNGGLYFVSGNYLFRFDGTNVTRLQWFGAKEPVTTFSMTANADYLFVQTAALTSAYVGDKFASASGVRRIYMYDGASWQMLNETQTSLSAAYSQALVMTGQGPTQYLYEVLHDAPFTSYTTTYYQYYVPNIQNPSVTTSSTIDITTSEFDADFPNVYKSLEVIEPLYQGLVAGDTIAVTYQTYDGKTWSAWQTAGTLTSTSANSIELTDASKKLFKRVKINIVLTPTNGSTATVKGISWRYTLQPRARWRWQVNIMAEGNSTITDRANNPITGDANYYTNAVLKSAKQKTPLFMLAPDYGAVKTGFNNSATSFIIKGQIALYTDPYSEYQLCAVKNNSGVWEVLRVSGVSYNSGTDETTITVAERGYYGVTPGTVNAGAEFHLAYKVYVTRLLRDQPVLDDQTYNEQASGESQLQREFMLELTEV